MKRAKERFQTLRNLNPVSVRRARFQDAGRMARLSTQLGYPVSQVEMGRRILMVSRRRDHDLFIAQQNKKLVGWMEVFRPLSILNWGKSEVGALIVDEERRHQGIGRLLMKRAEAWARRKGSRIIYLRSNVIRKEAHAFYRSTGYSIHKMQYVFRKSIVNKTKRIPK
jgi:GNAT superfamily N-acetyltransferase